MKSKITAIFIASIIMVFIAACAQQPEKPAEEFQEIIDTGILAVDSAPSQADVYVDGQLKGQTPLTLYNFPVGTYNIAVKKEGYSDFEKMISIRVGTTEEVDAELAPLKAEPQTEPTAKPNIEEPKDTPKQQPNMINLSSFAMYHDFENRLFTSLRSEKSDVFSRKYDKYIHFTSIIPAKINIINKPLKEATKSDCINARNAVAQLYSGQTLCVITMEGNYFALSGTWDKMPSELEFVELI